jgi:hypothetical protein
MFRSQSTRRGAILAAAGVVGLAVAAAVTPAEATKVGYPLCDSVNEVVTGDFKQFVPSAERNTNDACMLMEGSRGDLVRYLQDALRLCYREAQLVSDGIYGPRTAAAVKRAQQAHNIPADGVYGPQTRGVMNVHSFDRADLDRPATAMGFRVRDCASTDWQYALAFGRSGVPLLSREPIRYVN